MPRKREWRDRALRWEKLYYNRNEDIARERAVARLALEHIESERDQARRIAMHLEQENAALLSAISSIRDALTGAITADELIAMTDTMPNFNPYAPDGGTR